MPVLFTVVLAKCLAYCRSSKLKELNEVNVFIMEGTNLTLSDALFFFFARQCKRLVYDLSLFQLYDLGENVPLFVNKQA